MGSPNNTDEQCAAGMGTSSWELGATGIALLLNNKQKEAEALFSSYPDNIVMYSGYATAAFMDALMSFEDDKLAHATQILKETERRCSGNSWFKAVRVPLTKDQQQPSHERSTYADHLEMQIIRADVQMYLATLTFLQQDISAYFRGGWILRKSWKHYQQAHAEILDLYNTLVGDDTPPAKKFSEDAELVSSTVDVSESIENMEGTESPSQHTIIPSDMSDSSINLNSLQVTRNGYINKSTTMHFPPPTSKPSPTTNTMAMKKSVSANSGLSRLSDSTTPSLSHSLFADLSFSYLASLWGSGGEPQRSSTIDKETITRLMRSVSFGYGLLQLGMSLLPPSVLRLTNFLGFQGNRKMALASLMYAKNGQDMRAPLATLALLWYHTIVRPFFSLDGNNVRAGVEAAANLINEAMEKYSGSSLFLFFKGRVDRLKSDIPSAIEAFNSAIENTSHREVKILSQHEVGWCYLIQLDFENSMKTFLILKQQSRWSKRFYAYLCIISAGANEDLLALGSMKEFLGLAADASSKGTQLETFLSRRFRVCLLAKQDDVDEAKKDVFWKMLLYEMLYLWNSLPSCSLENVKTILNDCRKVGYNNYADDPFVGLSDLIEGSCYCILREYEKAVVSFRLGQAKRKDAQFQAEDAHISAFTHYELGQILIREETTKSEGKKLLQQIHSYKDYDFEQRLSVRIHSILKHL